MEIKPPNHRKDAVIDYRGWRHPRTGELLVSRKFTKEQIDAYNSGEAVDPQLSLNLPAVVVPTVQVISPEPVIATTETASAPAEVATASAPAEVATASAPVEVATASAPVDDGLDDLSFAKLKSIAKGENLVLVSTEADAARAEIRAARNK
jgi:hypothetical protein